MSEILKSDLEFENYTKRFDSEFSQKRYLKNIKEIQKNGFNKLSEFIKHISGGATPLGAEYEEEGIPFLRVQNIMQNYFNLNDLVFLNKNQDEKIKRSRLKERDVLLTITGVSYGKSAVVPAELVNSNINQHSVKIELNKKINPYFLSSFLNCKFGKLQSDKNIVGVTRPALDYTTIQNFKIPKIDTYFQNEIEKLIHHSEVVILKSKNVYTQGERILFEAASLSGFKPSKEPTNIKTFKESFLATGRLDAEYYQKKYDDLTKKIISQNYKRIKDIRTDNFRGLQPVYVEDGELNIINSKHILEKALDYDNFEKSSAVYWEIQKKARVFKGDILTYTTGANIGRTQVYQIDEKALASNHVNIIRLKTENPFYIGFVLNSLIGRMQTEKFSAGSAQAELYPKDLDEFIIPIIEIKKQQQIVSLVEESFRLKAQSERQLEAAKKAVEIAIEEGEDKAMEYIKISKL